MPDGGSPGCTSKGTIGDYPLFGPSYMGSPGAVIRAGPVADYPLIGSQAKYPKR